MELLTFSTDLELAQSAATAWRDALAEAPDCGRPYCVALSGGRITLKWFAAVIKLVEARELSLSGVEFFWADERCVPPTDPESSFAAAERHFFQPLSIPAERIHRIRGEESPEFAARQAEAEICRLAPLNGEGQPILDLVFLGMGEDGHVASLFPGEAPTVMAQPAVYRVVTDSPKPPPVRVTLGYGAIAAARQVWVLASGAGKEAALRESVASNGTTPLARVIHSRPNTRLFTDIRL